VFALKKGLMTLHTIGSRLACCFLLAGLFGACVDDEGRIESTWTTSAEITADLPPIAAFGVVCIDRTCTTDAEASSDDVFIANYHWSWGDGFSTSGSNASAATHTYAAYGSYGLTLSVFDSIGQLSGTVKLVTLVEGPHPNFTVSCVGRTCTFNASSSTGPAALVGFHWDWDDETTSTVAVPSVAHTFGFAATFRVHLRVTDANGSMAGITRNVVVP
jgi:large repetitive protein